MAGLRIIPRLDIKGPNLIKGIRLEGLRVVGDPHTFALPDPPQLCGAAQPPHLRIAPQPSLMSPQRPAHVSETHALAPHLLGPPPPQFGAAASMHVPQS